MMNVNSNHMLFLLAQSLSARTHKRSSIHLSSRAILPARALLALDKQKMKAKLFNYDCGCYVS
jgi:hypothetical protein